jgi:X-Pro dipeptidyl-peptidase (S15 family)
MTFSVMVPRTLPMRTRDGVRLDAEVWAPDTPGRFSVLLMRQPYGRRIASTVVYAHPAWYAAQGYVVAIQDVRGAGSSEGQFRLLADDAADGSDAVVWAAELPGSDGRMPSGSLSGRSGAAARRRLGWCCRWSFSGKAERCPILREDQQGQGRCPWNPLKAEP